MLWRCNAFGILAKCKLGHWNTLICFNLNPGNSWWKFLILLECEPSLFQVFCRLQQVFFEEWLYLPPTINSHYLWPASVIRGPVPSWSSPWNRSSACLTIHSSVPPMSWYICVKTWHANVLLHLASFQMLSWLFFLLQEKQQMLVNIVIYKNKMVRRWT